MSGGGLKKHILFLTGLVFVQLLLDVTMAPLAQAETSLKAPAAKSATKTKYDLVVEYLQLTGAYANIDTGMHRYIESLKTGYGSQNPNIANDKKFWDDFSVKSKEVTEIKKDGYKAMFNMYFSNFSEKELQDLIHFMRNNPAGEKLVKVLVSDEANGGLYKGIQSIAILVDAYVKTKLTQQKKAVK